MKGAQIRVPKEKKKVIKLYKKLYKKGQKKK